MRYSEKQVKIAASLLKNPKTINDLRDELGIPLNELENELAGMIKLKVVEKSGHPTKYSVIEPVKLGVLGEKKDISSYPFKARIIVEGQSKEKKALENANKKMIADLKSDKLIAVINLKQEKIQKQDDTYTVLFEAEIACKSFEDIIYCVLTYGPSSIEILEPREFSLKQDEAQGIAMDVANTIHAYVTMIAQLKLAKEEIVIK